MPSFDVVSEIDSHELTNAVDQAARELGNRFDFKGTGATFELNDYVVVMEAPSDFQLKQMFDILTPKITGRGISAGAMTAEDPDVNLARARQNVTMKHGIDKDTAKKIVKMIKGSKIKVQAAMQGEQGAKVLFGNIVFVYAHLEFATTGTARNSVDRLVIELLHVWQQVAAHRSDAKVELCACDRRPCPARNCGQGVIHLIVICLPRGSVAQDGLGLVIKIRQAKFCVVPDSVGDGIRAQCVRKVAICSRSGQAGHFADVVV